MRTSLPISLFLIISLITGSFTHESIKHKTLGSTLQAPVFISPVDNSSCETSCTFSWTSSGTIAIYEIWIADNVNFKNCEKYVTHETSYDYIPQFSNGIKKYTKVRAWNGPKSYSNWSNIISTTFGSPDLQLIRQGGCNGNCANCPNPCGRRSQY
jgi:hypothetical protein